MKNVAYTVLLLTSFALGCFGAFMVYHGLSLPTPTDASMNNASAIGVMSLVGACVGIVYTCAHALAHSK